MTLIPAATVVITSQFNAACEILLVKRNPELPVLGGVWAFPGGRIADTDGSAINGIRGEKQQIEAQSCAIRETAEETGIELNPAEMTLMTRWITPKGFSPRFDAWFFITATDQRSVQVDGTEIVDYQWIAAEEAIEAHHRGAILLAPPTFVLLSNFAAASKATSHLELSRGLAVTKFEPRLIRLPTGLCALYQEDAGYPDKDLYKPGPRHRLCMTAPRWRYLRSF